MSLVASQFFGAMNDNVLKGVLTFMVISGVWTGQLGAGGQGIVGICFTIPFMLVVGLRRPDRRSLFQTQRHDVGQDRRDSDRHRRGDRIHDKQLVADVNRTGRADLSEFVFRAGQVRHDSGVGRRFRFEPGQRDDQHDDQLWRSSSVR